MAQPTAYDRQYSFTNYQALNPSVPLPGGSVDLELNTVKATLDEVLTNLALIQRDDGAIANDSVGLDQLTSEVTVGFEVPTVWVTATVYATSNTAFHGSAFYRCLVAHTAGVFATDLAALKWQLIVDLSTIATVSALQVANTPAGNISSTTVQAAINELDSEKAALSHTHLSSAITDSTAAGRNMLSAANVAAQQTLLGLGSLAFLNTIPVTNITAQLALTGIIEPAALAVSTNDWAPTGIATCSTIRMSASAATVSLTGLLAPATDGEVKILENVGTYAIPLVPSSASSAAANRFSLHKPIIVGPNQSIALRYDGGDSRWRLFDNASRLPRGWLDGLTLSNNGADATNSIDIAIGEARGSRGILDLALTTGITKQLNNSWAAGTAAGGRYSGVAIADTTYHVFLIGKIDGTVDVFFYAGGLDPTSVLPTDYVDYRRIGSVLRESSSLIAFKQTGAYFRRGTTTINNSGANPGTSAVTITLATPTGITARAHLRIESENAGSGGTASLVVSALDTSDEAPGTTNAQVTGVINTSGGARFGAAEVQVNTNTSAQVRARVAFSDSSVAFNLRVIGWFDNRND